MPRALRQAVAEHRNPPTKNRAAPWRKRARIGACRRDLLATPPGRDHICLVSCRAEEPEPRGMYAALGIPLPP